MLAAPVLALLAVRWARNYHSALRRLEEGLDRNLGAAVPPLLRAVALYALFFLVIAAIFWMLAMSVSETGRPSFGLAGSIPVVALAWLVGFVTPGSSAGIGVREAVLIAALEGILGAPASTLVALALRLVTVGGDVVFFALGMTLGLTSGRIRSIAVGDDLAQRSTN